MKWCQICLLKVLTVFCHLYLYGLNATSGILLKIWRTRILIFHLHKNGGSHPIWKLGKASEKMAAMDTKAFFGCSLSETPSILLYHANTLEVHEPLWSSSCHIIWHSIVHSCSIHIPVNSLSHKLNTSHYNLVNLPFSSIQYTSPMSFDWIIVTPPSHSHKFLFHMLYSLTKDPKIIGKHHNLPELLPHFNLSVTVAIKKGQIFDVTPSCP